MSAIELKHVTLEYPRHVTALRDVSLSFPEGAFISLIGPSGSGKSSLLRVIAGLVVPKEGDVRFDGVSVLEKKPQERNVAMIFQNLALYPHMTVYKNIAYPLAARGYPKEEIRARVEETAQLLGLQDLLEKRPRRLSGGQKQLTAIARALVRKPDIFLLDEPFASLDEQTRSMLRAQIRRIHEQMPQTTFVYAAHDQAEAFALGERVVLLRAGSVLMHDTPQQMQAHPADLFSASFVGGGRMNLIRGEMLRDGETGREILLGILPEAIKAAGRGDPQEDDLTLHAVSDGLVRWGTGLAGAFTISGGSLLSGAWENAKVLFRENGKAQYICGQSEGWPDIGEAVVLAVSRENMNIYDGATGKRLIPGGGTNNDYDS